MKLIVKLVGGFSIVAVIALAVGLVGVTAIRMLNGRVSEIGGNRLPSVQSLLVISQAQTAIDGRENALLAPNLDAQGQADIYARFDREEKKASDARKVYEALPQTAEEAEVWKQFVPAWEAWWKDHAEVANPTPDGYTALSVYVLQTSAPTFNKANELLNGLVDINTKVAAEAADAARSRGTVLQAIALLAVRPWRHTKESYQARAKGDPFRADRGSRFFLTILQSRFIFYKVES